MVTTRRAGALLDAVQTSPAATTIGAALYACGAACAARDLGVVGGAVAVGVALLLCAWRRRAGPWLLAIPAALGATSLPPPPASWPAPGPVLVDGEVRAPVRRTADGSGVRLTLASVSGPRLWLDVDGPLVALPGDRVRGVARLTGWRRRVAQGRPPRARAVAAALTVVRGRAPPERWIEALGLRLERGLVAAIPGTSGLLLCHLVLGRGPPLPAPVVDAHLDAGTVHLLAVSGAHASMLALLAGILFAAISGRSPWTSRQYRWWCVLFLLLYAAITGMEPPVLRALVAFSLALHAGARGRRIDVAGLLAAPAIATAVLAPNALFGASFSLSYAAVFGLWLAGVHRAETAFARWVRGPVVASFWATLLTAPITLHLFGQWAPWTIVATPLLAPCIALMLGFGLLVAITAAVAPWLGAAGGALLAPLTAVYLDVTAAIATLPGAPVLATRRLDGALAAAALAGSLVWIARRPHRRRIGAACWLLVGLHFVPAGRSRRGELELCDVGHGLACVAHDAGGARLMVDCGSLGDPREPARRAARALLPARHLDTLVLTHGDHDHVGAIPTLLRTVRVDRAILPRELAEGALGALLMAAGVSLRPLSPGESLQEQNLHVERPALTAANHNDHSLWVRIDLGRFAVLLCGDALEHGVDSWLARNPEPAPVDVLVLPHHGRANPRLAALLDAARPSLALASNRAEPAPPGRTAQLAVRHIPLLETGNRGAIRLRAGRRLEVHCALPLRLPSRQ